MVKLYVFGGTFDPVTEGHISVVKALTDSGKAVLVAPTAKNPWKANQPFLDFTERCRQWDLVLKYEGVPASKTPESGKVSVSTEPYVYAYELVEKLKPQYQVVWVVGEDIKDDVKNWARWNELDIDYQVVPITVQVHATDIREGRVAPHPAIREIYENRC